MLLCCCLCALQVDKCIVGWDSRIGAWSRLENHCVLGEDVQVKVSEGAAANALSVAPYAWLSQLQQSGPEGSIWCPDTVRLQWR